LDVVADFSPAQLLNTSTTQLLLVHRFYIPPEQWNPNALVLRDSEAHHARAVLRLKTGDRVVVFNGQGREINGEIVTVARNEIQLRKLQENETLPLRCQITLGQAIPKGKNMDLIVQKAVEIGAAEIAPIISERTIVDLDPKEAEQKRAKWQQVAIEAAKQCGQNWLPRVQAPRKLKDFFDDFSPLTSHSSLPGLRLIGSLQSDAQHLKQILTDYTKEHGNRPSSVLMMIGPEGDFTPAELALAKSHGCLPITLGPIILRVETAAIYCLSVLSYELL
jgi:16S rRNA (uracil1498-N3)-methyltransferase